MTIKRRRVLDSDSCEDAIVQKVGHPHVDVQGRWITSANIIMPCGCIDCSDFAQQPKGKALRRLQDLDVRLRRPQDFSGRRRLYREVLCMPDHGRGWVFALQNEWQADEFHCEELIHLSEQKEQLEPWAQKAILRHNLGKKQAAAMNEVKAQKAEELRAFIRNAYRNLAPQIKAKMLLVKEAREIIRDKVELQFNDPDRPGYGYRPSDSTIDRALGKKDTKRKK